jgi:hypothetical protein
MYPKEIMTNVYWGFYGGKYDSYAQFIKEVTTYNKDFNLEWNPDETVLAVSSVTVQYSYWGEDEDDETEEDFNLVADDASGFTAGELLYKIHNKVVGRLENEDHHFFEGLTLWAGENYGNPNAPLYFLNQGS